MKECRFYKKGDPIQCTLCPHHCTIPEGIRGICKARINKEGTLFSLTYGRPTGFQIDPIEKKPLYHFFPGSSTLSFGTLGCNLSCDHCQNYQMSTGIPKEGTLISPEEVIRLATTEHCPSISFTYNEPTIFYEYMFDIAAKKDKLHTIMVSNGFIDPEPAKELSKVIDAANIDIKSMDESFYKDICGASLQPVLKAIKIFKENSIHVEITNLLIPGKNDNEQQIKRLITWVLNNLGPNTPLHFSAFHPMHKMLGIPPTPVETVKNACKMAATMGMNFVYAGNIPSTGFRDTVCPGCNETVITRDGKTNSTLTGGVCKCGEKITGRF